MVDHQKVDDQTYHSQDPMDLVAVAHVDLVHLVVVHPLKVA